MKKKEAGVADKDCFETRVGPGYFATGMLNVAELDVIDPRDYSHQSSIYVKNPETEVDLNQPLRNGLSLFFENIVINPSVINHPDEESRNIRQEIHLPEVPEEYKIEYFRRTVRKTYQFDQNNTISTSQVKVFANHQDPYFRSNNQSDVTDMFFRGRRINKMGRNLQPDMVLEEIETLLEFADKMMRFCLNEDPVN